MTKKKFGSRERLCAVQLFLKTWWWQYILMATLGWRRLWSLLMQTFWCLAYDLPRDRCNLSPDFAKILGRCHDCHNTKAGVASNQTHVNLLLSRNIPSHCLQLTSKTCRSVCRSPLERKWPVLSSSSAVKPGMYWQFLVKKRDGTVRVLLLCFWMDASICLGCQKSSFVIMRSLSTPIF